MHTFYMLFLYIVYFFILFILLQWFRAPFTQTGSWGGLGSSGEAWVVLGMSGRPGELRRPGEIVGSLRVSGRSRELWGALGKSGEVCEALGSFGELCGALGRSGSGTEVAPTCSSASTTLWGGEKDEMGWVPSRSTAVLTYFRRWEGILQCS